MNEIYNQSSYSILEIKSVIQNHLYTSSGKLNAAITRRDWFKSSTFYNEVMRLTEAHDITFAGRLVLILNDFPICPHCNIRPLSYYNRILETCNHPDCIAKVINEKRLATMREKYGANVSPLSIEKAKERIQNLQTKGRKTLLEKYGVINPGQLDHVKEAIKNSNKTRMYNRVFNEEYISKLITKYQKKIQSVEVINVTSISNSRFALDQVEYKCKCGCIETRSFGALLYREKLTNTACRDCSGLKYSSLEQLQLYYKIKQLAPDAILNDRVQLNGKELDIYIPSKRIAIEYHGIYWHSFNYVPTSKESRSHQEKHLLCKSNNIQLLQVLSNQDQNKFLELVKSKLGIFEERIFARKCIIQDISKNDAYKFLNDYHLQGCKTKTFSYSYGMFYQNELVGVITLCKSRFKLNEIELHRMVFKHSIQIIGGVSKFISHIKKQIGSFITYADAMIGGECYNKAGGKLLYLTEPNYWYVKMNGEIINRISAQRNKLKKLLGDGFNELLTEQENMLSNNYQIFFDAGNYKFEF